MIKRIYIIAFTTLIIFVVFFYLDKYEDVHLHQAKISIVNNKSNDDVYIDITNENAIGLKRNVITIDQSINDDIYSDNEELYQNFISRLNDSDSSSLSSFLNESLHYPESLDENIKAFRSAIISSDFNSIKELVNIFIGTELERDSIDSALDVAIVRGNVELVQYLINIGGEIKSSHLNSILSSQNSKFLESLENIGIELYRADSSDEDEISPLSYLIYTNINLNTEADYSNGFEKLLQAGYNINAESNGITPLFLSIRSLDTPSYKLALSYTRKLIDRGAIITVRHLTIMKKLSKSKPQLYKEIIEQIPQLDINFN